MKNKIISTLLSLCILLSVFAVGSVSASAATGMNAPKLSVKSYTNRSGYISNYKAGNTSDVFVGETKVYKLNFEKDTNFMVSASQLSTYDSVYDANVSLYDDINLTHEISMNTNATYGNTKFAYLKAGVYFLYVDTYSSSYTGYVYTGKIDGKEIKPSLSYVKTNNDGAKTATLKVSGYSNSDIASVCVDNCSYITSYYYFGSDSDVAFTKDNHIKVSYVYNNPVTYVRVYDVNGFYGTTYKIVLNKYTARLNNGSYSVDSLPSKNYTGKAVKQKGYFVKADYQEVNTSISYKNNKKIGTASMTFKGKGNTIGSYTAKFKINPSTVKKISAKGKSNTKSRNIKFSWSKSKGATSYVVQTKDSYSGKYKTVKKTKSKSCTIKVNNGVTYVQVYGVKKVKGKTYKSGAASLWTNCIYSSYRNAYDIYIH